jgi:hypothetical protein
MSVRVEWNWVPEDAPSIPILCNIRGFFFRTDGGPLGPLKFVRPPGAVSGGSAVTRLGKSRR